MIGSLAEIPFFFLFFVPKRRLASLFRFFYVQQKKEEKRYFCQKSKIDFLKKIFFLWRNRGAVFFIHVSDAVLSEFFKNHNEKILTNCKDWKFWRFLRTIIKKNLFFLLYSSLEKKRGTKKLSILFFYIPFFL